MKSSKLTQDNINNKKRELEDAEERRRRVLEAQLKIEEQRLRLESNVKKLNEATAAKQKSALEKKKKEELANQRKDLKSEGQNRTNVSGDLKGIENKYSLSNLDNKEQTPTNKQEPSRVSEDFRTSFSLDNRLTGSKVLPREQGNTEPKRFERDQIDHEENLPSIQRNVFQRQSSSNSQSSRREEKVENYANSHFEEKFELHESPLESWEMRKSQVDRLNEEELDLYRAELRDIKESLKNFDSNLTLSKIENNSNAKKQNLMRESLQGQNEQINIPAVSYHNESGEPSSSKGFQRRPLPKQEIEHDDYFESSRNEVHRLSGTKEKIDQKVQPPLYHQEEMLTKKSFEPKKYEQQYLKDNNHQSSAQKLQPEFPQSQRAHSLYQHEEPLAKKITESHQQEQYTKETNQTSSRKLQVENIREDIQRNYGRGALDEKTKLQLEISSKIKQLQTEKERERKKNEEAALKAKQQILNQLKNKNQEPGRPSVIREEEEPMNRSTIVNENRSTQEGTPNLSSRIQQREEVYEPEFSNRQNKYDNIGVRESLDRRRPESSVVQGREWERDNSDQREEEDDEEDERKENSEEQNEDNYEEDEEFEEEEFDDSEPNQEIQREAKQESPFKQQNYYLPQPTEEVRESKYSIQRSGYKNEDYNQYQEKWNEEPIQNENFTYAQLHSRAKQPVQKNPVESKTQDSLSNLVRDYEKSYHDTLQAPNQNAYQDNYDDNKKIIQVRGKDQKDLNNLATFGRKEFEENDERSDRSQTSGYEEQLEKVRVHDEDSEEDIDVHEDEEEKYGRNDEDEEADNEESNHRSTSNFGKHQNEPISHIHPESNRHKIPYEDLRSKQNEREDYYGEKSSFRKQESFQESRRSRDEQIPQHSSKFDEKPIKQGRGWAVNKPSEETSGEEEEENPQSKNLSAKQEDFKTANFGYNETNKPTRVRKGWGEQPKTEDIEERVISEPNLKEQIRENEDDEEEVLETYKQIKSTQRSHREEKEAQEEPKQENVVLVFDDNKDKEKKQKQYENMMKRLERNNKAKEKKERERSFVGARKQREKETHDFVVSDNSGHSEETPKNIHTKSKRIVSAIERPSNQKPPEPANAKHSYSRKLSANVGIKAEKQDNFEEMKSVEPSVKSTKSMTKSPGGPNNNIFQTPKSGHIVGQKKSAIEFSKQSNRQIIRNAITNVCLAGELNRKEREEILAKVNEIKTDVNFIIVFKAFSGRQDFKALYVYDSAADEIRKLYSNGNAPAYLDASLVENYYRYNSGSKEFKPIQGNKNFSLAVDAVSLQPHVFKKVPNDRLY